MLALLAGGIVLAIALAPALRQQSNGLAEWIYLAFAPTCHQIAERSFHAFSHPLAVCHRCFGIYIGLLVGVLAWPAAQRAKAWLQQDLRRVVWLFVPTVVDWLLFGWNTPTSRFLTGAVAGLALALLASIAAQQLAATFDRTSQAAYAARGETS